MFLKLSSHRASTLICVYLSMYACMCIHSFLKWGVKVDFSLHIYINYTYLYI